MCREKSEDEFDNDTGDNGVLEDAALSFLLVDLCLVVVVLLLSDSSVPLALFSRSSNLFLSFFPRRRSMMKSHVNIKVLTVVALSNPVLYSSSFS